MYVDELNRKQLIQLKETYLDELNEAGEYEEIIGTSYDELINADDIVSDDIIFEHFCGIDFSEDDFWC